MKIYKTFLLFLLTLFFQHHLIAQQLEEVNSNIEQPYGLLVNGDDLFVGGHVSGIFRLSITQQPPFEDEYITGGPAFGFREIVYLDETLYANVDVSINDDREGKIFKIDISGESAVVTDFITGLDDPRGLALNGNDLYIAHDGKIEKTDITDSTHRLTTVVAEGFFSSTPSFLEIHNGFLYISDKDANVSKVDLATTNLPATPTVVLENPGAPYGLAFKDNHIFVVLSADEESGTSRIVRYNLTDLSAGATELVGGLTTPRGITFDGDYLYIAEESPSKVSRINISTLSSASFEVNNRNIEAHPIPAKKQITISGADQETDYEIYDLKGQKIDAGTLSDNKKIDVQKLTTGSYILKFDKKKPIQILKKTKPLGQF